MNNITTIGLDLAKKKFHLVGVDASGKKVLSKKLMRSDVLSYFEQYIDKSVEIAMEACGGCNYYAQELSKLGFTKIKLFKPKDVKPYAKSRQKNDFNDSLAIAKSARDPELKLVQPKNKYQQEIMLLHKLRQNCIDERKQKSNSLMSSLLEFGYVTICRKAGFARECINEIELAYSQNYITEKSKNLLIKEAEKIAKLLSEEKEFDKELVKSNKGNEKAIRLQTIPGIGPVNASILSILSVESYDNPRDFAASLGLVPSQHTTGGKVQLGRISKQGNRYARTMLIQGARTIVMQARINPDKNDKLTIFAKSLLAKDKGFNKTAVAVANKIARIAFALTIKQQNYQSDNQNNSALTCGKVKDAA